MEIIKNTITITIDQQEQSILEQKTLSPLIALKKILLIFMLH